MEILVVLAVLALFAAALGLVFYLSINDQEDFSTLTHKMWKAITRGK